MVKKQWSDEEREQARVDALERYHSTPEEQREEWAKRGRQQGRETYFAKHPERRYVIERFDVQLRTGVILRPACRVCGKPMQARFDWDAGALRDWYCYGCKEFVVSLDEPSVEAQRVEQLEAIKGAAQRYADRMLVFYDKLKDWSYVPPASDNPEEWKGLTKWCYIERAYTWHCEREGLLGTGHGPYYCPEHGEARPTTGWQPRACFPCAWEGYLYDEALRAARELGRAWTRTAVPA